MNNEMLLKEKIKEQINGSYAHTPYTKILDKITSNQYSTNPPNVDYNLWELLEHIRISHLDILEFIENPNYKEMKWPEEYWPTKDQVVTKHKWEKTVKEIQLLYTKTYQLLDDENLDIYAELQHAKGYHYLREFLLIAEHNAYHFGQLMSYVKVLNEN